MKRPEEVRTLLARRYQSQHRAWLHAAATERHWPLEVALGVPTQAAALRQVDGVRAWVEAWQRWQGSGSLSWCERRWKLLGVQRLPQLLSLHGPAEVAQWVGEAPRWAQAEARYQVLLARWPALAPQLPRHFEFLADSSAADFDRLAEMLAWLARHPQSGLYPRQLPVAGLDSKWLEGRKALLADLLAALQGQAGGALDFYQRCGLKAPPALLRLRLLDPALRARLGGLGDISVPLAELAALDLPVARVFIVENLQTGLAMTDLPGAVVLMRLGYHVDVLGRIPWLAAARCFYWGDLDSHGLAILHQARAHLPDLQSVLMDEGSLLRHRPLWVEEKTPHAAEELSRLNAAEQQLYRDLKQQRWGQNLRLEQERIDWAYAWQALRLAAGL